MLRRFRHRFPLAHHEVRFQPLANVSVRERLRTASSSLNLLLGSSGMAFISPFVLKMCATRPFKQTMSCKTKVKAIVSVVQQRKRSWEGWTTYCLENPFSWKMRVPLTKRAEMRIPCISSERGCENSSHFFPSNCSGTNTSSNGSRSCSRSRAVSGSSGGASGFIRRTRVCFFPFSSSASYYQKHMESGNTKKGTRAVESMLESSLQNSLYASSFSLDSSRTDSNAGGLTMLATAAALEKTRNQELMDDKQIAAEASKLLRQLAPLARGSHLMKNPTHLVNGRGARQSLYPLKSSADAPNSKGTGVIPSHTTTYITPPAPRRTLDHDTTFSSVSRHSTLPLTKPLDTLSSGAVPSPQPFTTGLPSRRPRIPMSKRQKQEFDEAFEAAEAVLQEEAREAEEQRKEKKKKRKSKGAAGSDEVVKSELANLTTTSSFHLHPATLSTEKESTTHDFFPSLPAAVSALPTTSEATSSPSISPHSIANPFKGLHEFLFRSYRLDEVLHAAKVTDLVFSKQEPKAAVFSFFSFRSGLEMYRQHWEVREEVQRHHTKASESFSMTLSGSNEALDMEEEEERRFIGGEIEEVALEEDASFLCRTAGKKSRSRKNSLSKDLISSTNNTLRRNSCQTLDSSPTGTERSDDASGISYASVDGDDVSVRPTQRVADAVLQWGGIGWDHTGVEVDYSLIVAQRLLLFPPEQRFFHALAGRPDVPCDFFADLDLADFTAEEGEKTLVEVLDYLEVRLPGVGFTDPFFLVLENEDADEMWCSSDHTPTTSPFAQEGNSGRTLLSGPPFTKLDASFLCSGSETSNLQNGKGGKRKKVSYHIHARSMTHVMAREERNMSQLRKVLKQGSRKRIKMEEKKKKNRNLNGASEESSLCASSSFSLSEVPNGEMDDEHTEVHGEEDDLSLFCEMEPKEHPTAKKNPKDEKKKGKGAENNASAVKPKSVTGAIKTVVFQDYRVVRLIAEEINQTLGFNALDEGCYRSSGSLRCAFSRKIPPSLSSTPVSPVNAAAAALHSYRTSLKDNNRASLSGGGGEESTGKSPLAITNGSSSEKVIFSSHGAPSIPGLQPALVPARIRPNQHPDLTKKLQRMHHVLQTLTAPEILEMTFCTRHLPDGGTATLRVLQEHLGQRIFFPTKRTESVFKATALHQFKLVKPHVVIGVQNYDASSDSSAVSVNGAPMYSPLNGVVEYDSYGNAVSPFLTEGAKWKRYKTVVAKLESISPQAAMNFDIWVRVGLALHNFSNEERVFEEWVKFSVKCPQKFSREACKKKWLQFERNPDALNWRRGFNYLNHTLWRQL